jgi:uncharacterized membrane protein YoaK (UPF0700 family)
VNRIAAPQEALMTVAAAPAHRVLVVALTAAAASTDAVSFLGLGRVFPANMTGNTVLLGIGLATADHAGAARSAVTLGAYVLAAFTVAAATAGQASPAAVRCAFAVELALLAALAGWWLSLPAHPGGPAQYGLVALAGAAMGTQSATAKQLRLPGIATTYISGTWTSLSTGLGRRLRGAAGPPRSAFRPQALVVVTYAVVAFVAAAAFVAWHAAAALIPVALLGLATTRHIPDNRQQSQPEPAR